MNKTQMERIKYALVEHEIMLETRIQRSTSDPLKDSYRKSLRKNLAAQVALEEVGIQK